MKKIKCLALTIGLLAPFFAAPLYAAVSLPTGFYLEGNVGSSHSGNKNYGSGTSYNNSGFAWNINGGYKFMQYLALEAGGTSYASSNVKNAAGTQFEKDRHYSYDLAMKGIVPLADTGVEVFGKLGAARVYSSISITDHTAAAAAGVTSGSKKSSTSLYMGAGAGYFFMPTLGLNIQWARAKGNSQTGVQDLYSAGLLWDLY